MKSLDPKLFETSSPKKTETEFFSTAPHAPLNPMLFYFVRPNDCLWNIARTIFRPSSAKTIAEKVAEIKAINTHIRKDDVIYPGQLLTLPTMETSILTAGVVAATASITAEAWKKASPDAKEIVQKNFDLLDWLSDRQDELDFLENLGRESLQTLKEVPQVHFDTIPGEVVRWSVIRKDLMIVRNGTIRWLYGYALSPQRQSILIITTRTNALYAYANKLTKMIELAEKFKLGKKVFLLEVGLEMAKAVRVGVNTKSWKETGKQAGRGTLKITGGASGGYIAKKICKVSIKRGRGGWLVCATALGVGLFGGEKFGEKIGNALFGPPLDLNLPALP